MRLSGARILLVEDNMDLAENVQEILEDEGAQVDWSSTARAAREAAAEPFDIALVDVRLPDASGVDLLTELHAKGDGLAEVLLVTGNATVEDAIAAVEGGAYAYLLKPVDPVDLIVTVERGVQHVRATREARALSHELEEKEARLSTLVDTVQALLLVLDEEGRVVQANPAVAAAVGVPADELVGRLWLEEFVPDADRPGVEGVFERLVAGERNVSHENRILSRDPDGTIGERWVRWQSSPHENGNALWVYASGLDMTETRVLEARARLSERLAAVGTLTAGLAHEVRNPLNAALLQLSLLERRVCNVPECASLEGPLELIKQEIQRLTELVNDFMGFARPRHLQLEDVDVCSLAAAVVDMERPAAAESRVELTVEACEGPVIVCADPGKLRQILLNMIRNGVEAIAGEGRVTVHVGRDGAGVRVTIRDTGPGVPDEHLEHLFEPFFTTKEHGTGLGMAICHALVTQHGGSVSVRNESGAVFDFTLPRRPPNAPRHVC